MANDASTIDYRALLIAERTSLEDELGELGVDAHGDKSLSYDANFADTSQVTAERGENEALVNELRGALDAVLRAIERLDGGTYGICERCARTISPARLEAMPAVTTCIDCASKSR